MLNVMDRDGRKYSADRDIINLYPKIERQSAYLLAREGWDAALADYARHTGITDADMIAASETLARFQYACTVGPSADFPDAWERAGFAALKPAARLAVCYVVGHRTMAAFHHHVREALPRGGVVDPLNPTAEVR
jgi:hypothetical protein